MALQPELVCPVSVESEVANCWFPLLEAAEHREHSEWLSLLLWGWFGCFPKGDVGMLLRFADQLCLYHLCGAVPE